MDVPRSLLELVGRRELWLTDVVVLKWVHYRAGRKHTVDVAELVALTGFCRQYLSRVLRELRAAGWLDEDNRPAKPLPIGKPGFLRVHFDELRAGGSVEAALFAQLKSLPTMRVAELTADGARAPTGMLASMLGLCRDTIRAAFARLSSGDTVRSRLAARRGRVVQRRSWIALQKAEGVASRVRVRGEREEPRPSSSSSTPAPAPERAPVPSWTELLAMAKAATTRPPPA